MEPVTLILGGWALYAWLKKKMPPTVQSVAAVVSYAKDIAANFVAGQFQELNSVRTNYLLTLQNLGFTQTGNGIISHYRLTVPADYWATPEEVENISFLWNDFCTSADNVWRDQNITPDEALDLAVRTEKVGYALTALMESYDQKKKLINEEAAPAAAPAEVPGLPTPPPAPDAGANLIVNAQSILTQVNSIFAQLGLAWSPAAAFMQYVGAKPMVPGAPCPLPASLPVRKETAVYSPSKYLFDQADLQVATSSLIDLFDARFKAIYNTAMYVITYNRADGSPHDPRQPADPSQLIQGSTVYQDGPANPAYLNLLALLHQAPAGYNDLSSLSLADREAMLQRSIADLNAFIGDRIRDIQAEARNILNEIGGEIYQGGGGYGPGQTPPSGGGGIVLDLPSYQYDGARWAFPTYCLYPAGSGLQYDLLLFMLKRWFNYSPA